MLKIVIQKPKGFLVENGSSLNIVNFSDNNCRLEWQGYHIDKNKN